MNEARNDHHIPYVFLAIAAMFWVMPPAQSAARDQTAMGHRAPHVDIPGKADKTFPAGKIAILDQRGRTPGGINLPRGEGFG